MNIMQGAIIEKNVKIGHGSTIGYNTVVESDVVIGRNVRIFSLCNITKGAIIEDDVFIGVGVMLTNTNKISHGRSSEHTGKWEPPKICRGARIASNVTILPGVVIGEECLIGAHSLVTRDTEPFGVYYGVPARWIRPVSPEERL